jgi:aspartate/tyrosine/aromatic aminotransferase
MEGKIKNNWRTPPQVLPDPILGIMLDARADTRINKVDLTAGVYKDEKMKPFVLNSVKAIIENIVNEKDVSIFRQLPSMGDTDLADLLFATCFGIDNALYDKHKNNGRWSRMHCQSGGNGLFFIFEILKRFYPFLVEQSSPSSDTKPSIQNSVWCAADTWPIHTQMLNKHKIHIKTHRYYNAEKNCFDFDGMIEDLKEMKEGDILLLQPAGHNPTGYDCSREQWKVLAQLIKLKKVQTILDFAYMGYASGDIDDDSFPVRYFLEQDLEFYLTISCSKNFGLYSARVGAIGFYMHSISVTKQMTKYLGDVSKLLFAAPNSLGSHVVREILNDESSRALWLKDLAVMTNRIKSCRSALKSELDKTGSKYDWSFIVRQLGMFAYTGLSQNQVLRLKNEFGIYLINSGRASITGLTTENAAYVAKAFHEVTK